MGWLLSGMLAGLAALGAVILVVAYLVDWRQVVCRGEEEPEPTWDYDNG